MARSEEGNSSLSRLQIRVECYAGYKGAERPVRFYLGERCFEVVKVLDQWYGPKETYFKVLADDRNFYILRHREGELVDQWTLESFRRGEKK